MLDLTRNERIILITLVIALATGLGIQAYLSRSPHTTLTVTRFDASSPDAVHATGRAININSAGADELMRVRGIGPKLAGRIVAYRTAHGSFGSVDDLRNVPGIKDALVERIKDDLCVE